MRRRWQRALLASGALTMLGIGAAAVVSAWEPTQPGDVGLESGEGLIEIRDFGFNPPNCFVSGRDTPIHFINKTTEQQRVLGVTNPYIDTGVLEPDELSKGFRLEAIGTFGFYLEGAEAVSGTMKADSGFNCLPAGPTPTPTNTPTPTPTPSPTPTMEPTPEGRKGLVPQIAKDEPAPPAS